MSSDHPLLSGFTIGARVERLSIEVVSFDFEFTRMTHALCLRGRGRATCTDTFEFAKAQCPRLPVPRSMLPMLHRNQLVELWGTPTGEVIAMALADPRSDPYLHAMVMGAPTGVVTRDPVLVTLTEKQGCEPTITTRSLSREEAAHIYNRAYPGQTLPDRAYLEHTPYEEVQPP